MLDGDELALSRLVTLVESSSAAAASIMSQVKQPEKAFRIGLTGPPGAGKSALVGVLTSRIRASGMTVGIVAVDPTSPFSGGAVLGDRIRMQEHYLDEGVFIRSLATRGASGGLSRAVRDVVNLLEASGKDVILIETVGVGQNEVDILYESDTVLVVLTPESGDAMQAMKAGLLEIADVFVVNKADRPGADALAQDLEGMLHMTSGVGNRRNSWSTPVLMTQATESVGIDELLEVVRRHRQTVEESGELGESHRQRRKSHFVQFLSEEIRRRVQARIEDEDDSLSPLIAKVVQGEISPYAAALSLLEDDAGMALAEGLARRPGD